MYRGETMRLLKSKGKRKDNTSFYRDRSMTQPFDLDQYLAKNGSDVANGGKGELTTSKRMKWVLGASVFGAVAGIVLLAVVLFGWKPFDHIDEGNKDDLVDSEEVIHNYTNNNNEDSVVGNERYTNPIVYLAGQALYVCDEDGSKKVCLTEEAYQYISQTDLIKFDIRYKISEDKRFIVYSESFINNYFSGDGISKLCIYDLETGKKYQTEQVVFDYKITTDNFLLMKGDQEDSICWVDLQQVDSYVKEVNGNNTAYNMIELKSVSYTSPDAQCYLFFNDFYFSKDRKILIAIGHKSTDTYHAEEDDFVGAPYLELGADMRPAIVKVDLGSQKVIKLWESIYSYHIDYMNKETYFLQGNVLYHLNSDLEVNKVKDGVDYFYMDSTSDYLVYLSEQKQEQQSILQTDLIEDYSEVEHSDELSDIVLPIYGVYDLTIEYQKEQTTYSSLTLCTVYIGEVNEKVLLLRTKKDSVKKVSMDEYKSLGQVDDGIINLAFDRQYLIGTKLYSEEDIKGCDYKAFYEDRNQLIVYSNTYDLKQDSEIAQLIKREGNEVAESVIFNLDLNTGKVADYYLYDQPGVRYLEHYGKEFLAFRSEYIDDFNNDIGDLYYGTKIIGNNISLNTVQKVDNKGIFYLIESSALFHTSDLYFCDENGQTQLIDTDVTNFCSAGNGVVNYIKGASETDAKLYCYKQGKILCLDIKADAIMSFGDLKGEKYEFY